MPATIAVPVRSAPPPVLPKLKISRTIQKDLVMPGKGFVDTYDSVINPYQGCSFGCSYCYASNFTQTQEEKETWGQWVKVKTNAGRLMASRTPGSLNGKTVYMATTTDPYQPAERTELITKSILRQLVKLHPRVKLVVQTRAPLVCRDLEFFREIMNQGGQVQVNMTVTTDDERIRRIYEPGCPGIEARLKAVRSLEQGGVRTCITATPMLPLSDPAGFAGTMLAAGCRSFIFQPFKSPDLSQGSNVAITDRRAVESAMRWYQTKSESGAMRRYRQEYQENEKTLKAELSREPGVRIGFGKNGFKPPF